MLKAQILSAVAIVKTAVQDLVFDAKMVVRGASVHVPGSAPSYPETLYDVKVFWSSYKAKEIDNDRILASDMQGLIFPETEKPVPKPNDMIRVGSTNYRIIMNDKVMAGDEVALSQVQLRLM